MRLAFSSLAYFLYVFCISKKNESEADHFSDSQKRVLRGLDAWSLKLHAVGFPSSPNMAIGFARILPV